MVAVTKIDTARVPFAPDGRAKLNELVEACDPEGAVFAANMILWLDTLPTSDPQVAGEPWLNTGVLTVSAGA